MRYADLDKTLLTCKQCGYKSQADFERTEKLTHYGKAVCHECNAFLCWVTKPDTPATCRPSAHTKLTKFKQPDVRYCEMCQRVELPGGQSLEGHHVLDYSLGGDATAINAWVLCTECHSLVNWRRKYAVGARIHEDNTAFESAVRQQRATRDAGEKHVGSVEDHPKAKRTDQGPIPGERGNGKQHGPKHLGDILRRDDQSPPF